ncbi:hypothetical protein [Methylobacterium oxalidis]|nr:hypothetical protein [Methylobacterium oxalidis]GJE35559.1 hypothetical protein LDDCCGHA_5778 [Methylobacterium oxalidis]
MSPFFARVTPTSRDGRASRPPLLFYILLAPIALWGVYWHVL